MPVCLSAVTGGDDACVLSSLVPTSRTQQRRLRVSAPPPPEATAAYVRACVQRRTYFFPVPRQHWRRIEGPRPHVQMTKALLFSRQEQGQLLASQIFTGSLVIPYSRPLATRFPLISRPLMSLSDPLLTTRDTCSSFLFMAPVPDSDSLHYSSANPFPLLLA